jgi:cobalt-zinc-cadmium efflux system protein
MLPSLTFIGRHMGQRHTETPAGHNTRRLAAVFGLTAVFLVAAEVIGRVLTRSLALLADAGHMLTDVARLGLALLAIASAERPATPERTYGYYCVEILAALHGSARPPGRRRWRW